MSSIIEFRFEGTISPKTVSLKELRDLLANLENFFIPLMLKENPHLKRGEIKISLVEIREGSYNLGIDSPQRQDLIVVEVPGFQGLVPAVAWNAEKIIYYDRPLKKLGENIIPVEELPDILNQKLLFQDSS